MTGLFITFEGGEGTGKSTQVKLLASRLRDRDVVVTREPGGTQQGEALRNLLVSGDVNTWTPVSEALLNVASRTEHVRNVISASLAAGKVVICDRFMDSTRAYQGYAGGVDLALIDHLERVSVGIIRPHLTLVFDIAPELGLERTKSRGDDTETRFERKGLAFHQALRDAFRHIAEANPERCKLIDASKTIAEVEAIVWSHVEALVDGR